MNKGPLKALSKLAHVAILSILLTMVSLFAAASPANIDIVFDLDWTLINTTTEAMAKAAPENTFQLQGKIYRFSDHMSELLLALHAEPHVRISYMSGGEAKRNAEVVRRIYEILNKDPRGHGLKPHLVLSLDNLIPISQDTRLEFFERYKKDLGQFFDLNSTVLVDDIKGFVPAGQEKNMLWLGKTYNDRPYFHLANLENPADASFSAPNKSEWLRDKNKLLPVKEILLEAIRRTKTPQDFIKNLDKIQKSMMQPSCRQIYSRAL